MRDPLASLSIDYDFDVALSYASEDGRYVRAVASSLRRRGLRVFFDEYERTDMWGKDLYAHLDDVYRNKARYCIMFISTHYAAKVWTNHERRSAQARALREGGEYILPARFDDSELPGMPPTIGWIDATAVSPTKLAGIVESKVLSDDNFRMRWAYDRLRQEATWLEPLVLEMGDESSTVKVLPGDLLEYNFDVVSIMSRARGSTSYFSIATKTLHKFDSPTISVRDWEIFRALVFGEYAMSRGLLVTDRTPEPDLLRNIEPFGQGIWAQAGPDEISEHREAHGTPLPETGHMFHYVWRRPKGNRRRARARTAQITSVSTSWPAWTILVCVAPTGDLDAARVHLRAADDLSRRLIDNAVLSGVPVHGYVFPVRTGGRSPTRRRQP